MSQSNRVLDCGGKPLDLSFPVVMGVVNTTPDSFSDGGLLYANDTLDLDRAMTHARRMVNDGAAILDIGGESTRPGASPVSPQQEMDRVLPLVEKITAELDVVVSVDTSTPALMTAAASAGAGLINDVRALSRDGALAAAAATGLPVCLMHMQGEPGTMQAEPRYDDVVTEVTDFLAARVVECENGGIVRERLLLDPGFGFGKTLAHNLQLLAGLDSLVRLGLPVLAGLSRKSMIGAITGREVQDRLAGSIALAVMAVERGAVIVRAHDVAETADALAIHAAMARQDKESGDL